MRSSRIIPASPSPTVRVLQETDQKATHGEGQPQSDTAASPTAPEPPGAGKGPADTEFGYPAPGTGRGQISAAPGDSHTPKSLLTFLDWNQTG